jgi:protein-S-isoprenylcysteine O-methyltransferase Ste14
MQQRKKLLIEAVCGAIIGALATLFGGPIIARIPAFTFDHSPMGRRQLLFACIPWVLFSLYWEVAARNSAATAVSESQHSRAFHVVLSNVAVLLEIAPFRGLGRFLPASYPYIAAGLAVELMGLFLAIWARRCLGRNWSGEISIKVEHRLIRSGPYRVLRHPIYTGLLAMYVGTALVSGRWLAIIGLALAVFAYWRKIQLEEANLNVAFGADYDAYRRETWALVPGMF